MSDAPKRIASARMDTIAEIWAIAKERQSKISGMSWGGFNLIGDRKSIDEVRRLLTCESRMKALEERLK